MLKSSQMRERFAYVSKMVYIHISKRCNTNHRSSTVCFISYRRLWNSIISELYFIDFKLVCETHFSFIYIADYVHNIWIVFICDQCDYTDDYAGVYERSEEHTSELQSRFDLVCRLLLEK